LNESSGTPELIPIDKYTGKDNHRDMFFLPKSSVDFMGNEVMRGIRMTNKTAQWISFKVPRRENKFAEDLFPPHPKTESVMTYDEWASGTDKDPILT
jgi:coronin-2